MFPCALYTLQVSPIPTLVNFRLTLTNDDKKHTTNKCYITLLPRRTTRKGAGKE